MNKINLIKEALYSEIKPRKNISLPRHETFGLEIEMEDVDFETTKSIVHSMVGDFVIYNDLSLKNNGAEVVTPPMRNSKLEMLFLKNLSYNLKKLDPTFRNCSLQVNFQNNFTFDELKNFFKLYCYFEKIIYIFSKGEDPLLRNKINIYANLIFNDFAFEYQKYKFNEEELFQRFSDNKMFGLNLKECGLIEFRTPNGTVDYSLWLNYIQTFYSMIDCIKKGNFNDVLLDEYMKNYLKHLSNNYTLDSKDFSLDVEKSVEFAETIFNQDEDKVYFLKQCFSSKRKKVEKYLENNNL